MSSLDPTQTQAWKNLTQLADPKAFNIDLSNVKNDRDRAKSMQVSLDNLVFQYARNLVDPNILKSLVDLAHDCKLNEGINAMFSGQKINETENRAVLHTALRNSKDKGLIVDGQNIFADIQEVLLKMKNFSGKIISGEHQGYTGKPISDIVNIGIGGSDLGPFMAYEALQEFGPDHIRAHYVSNVDGSHLTRCLRDLKPETTLFIIASKTFTTQETMANAKAAKEWFLAHGDENSISKHFVALSTNIEVVKRFGISEELIFGFWNWVGGRYSIWSAIGLSLCCSLGYDNFEQLLRGAESIDHHFQNADFSENIPVLMALLGIWYNNFLGWESHAILPYDQRLHHFPSYLQQADMESNGKTTDKSGKSVAYQTGPIIWGEPGTNGQHAFYQLLHQGTKNISCDFIAGARAAHDLDHQQNLLIANFLAQPQALMNGLSGAEVERNMKKEGADDDMIQKLIPHRTFSGNRPSSTIFYKELNPFTLGQLIALYEHKIFTQGWIWNVFSFDQWGVELGKKVANGIIADMEATSTERSSDAVTEELIELWNKWKK